MCQFWHATRLMVQDWHRVNQPLGATEFSCFHIKIFPEDEESIIGTDSALFSTLSGWSIGTIGTLSFSVSDGSLESLESRGSLFLNHMHINNAFINKNISQSLSEKYINMAYKNTCQWNPAALQSFLFVHLQQFQSLSNRLILTPEITLV